MNIATFSLSLSLYIYIYQFHLQSNHRSVLDIEYHVWDVAFNSESKITIQK